MADGSSGSDGEVKTESKGKMTQRHKREQKDLAATTTKMLSSVSKIDKKKKTEVETQVAALQQQMQKRHDAELAGLAGGSAPSQSTTPAAPVPAAAAPAAATEPAQPKTKSKAAKKRETKEREELDRQARVKDEKANVVSARQVELDAIARRLTPIRLEVKEMPSDGDCLFAALSDQLSQASRAQKSSLTVKSLRALAASHIRAHKADFEPFLLATDDGLDDAGIDGYCARLETTKLWGGEVEIRALSEALRVPVVVYSSDMAPHVIGGEVDPPLRVSFHKHYLSLGAHYNSIVPALGEEP